MANMSTASGRLEFVGGWTRSEMNEMVMLLTGLEAMYYSTTLDNLEDLETSFSCSFTGVGRGTYLYNLETLDLTLTSEWYDPSIKAIADHTGHHLSFSEYKRRYKNILTTMELNNLSMVWTGTDHEVGHQVLYEFTLTHTAKNGRLIVLTHSKTDYDCTLKNLVDIADEDGLAEDAIVEIAHLTDTDTKMVIKAMECNPQWFHLRPHVDTLADIPPQLIDCINDLKRSCDTITRQPKTNKLGGK